MSVARNEDRTGFHGVRRNPHIVDGDRGSRLWIDLPGFGHLVEDVGVAGQQAGVGVGVEQDAPHFQSSMSTFEKSAVDASNSAKSAFDHFPKMSWNSAR